MMIRRLNTSGGESIEPEAVSTAVGAEITEEDNGTDEKKTKYVCHICKLQFDAGEVPCSGWVADVFVLPNPIEGRIHLSSCFRICAVLVTDVLFCARFQGQSIVII